MTDVILPNDDAKSAAHAPDSGMITDQPLYELIELLFFAYRDFVRDPDEILDRFGFGRAHHRVLHFVNRHPGLKVTELLDILKITKQSLGRVLRELIEQEFIESRAGKTDRRQRLLFTTPRGKALAEEMAHLQTCRIRRALEIAEAGTGQKVAAFLLGMVDPAERMRVEARIRLASERGDM